MRRLRRCEHRIADAIVDGEVLVILIAMVAGVLVGVLLA